MLGNGSSERYKQSRVLHRQVTITFRLVPPATHRVGWSKNIWVYQRMLLGAWSRYLAGNKAWAVEGWPGGRSLPLGGTAGRGVFPGAMIDIIYSWTFLPIVKLHFLLLGFCVIRWEITRYTSVLVLLQDFIISQHLGDKVGPSGWDPVLHWV